MVDFVVYELFGKLDVKLISKILYEKICYFVIKCMISILNGIRFMYIELFFIGKYFFRVNYCGGI